METPKQTKQLFNLGASEERNKWFMDKLIGRASMTQEEFDSLCEIDKAIWLDHVRKLEEIDDNLTVGLAMIEANEPESEP